MLIILEQLGGGVAVQPLHPFNNVCQGLAPERHSLSVQRGAEVQNSTVCETFAVNMRLCRCTATELKLKLEA